MEYDTDKKWKEFVSSTASVERNECQSKSIMPSSYVCQLVVPLITVPQNKGQYMYDTQDQLEGYYSTRVADIVALESADAWCC